MPALRCVACSSLLDCTGVFRQFLVDDSRAYEMDVSDALVKLTVMIALMHQPTSIVSRHLSSKLHQQVQQVDFHCKLVAQQALDLIY